MNSASVIWGENSKLSIELQKRLGRPLSIFPRDPENLKLDDLPVVSKEQAPDEPTQVFIGVTSLDEIRGAIRVGRRYGILGEHDGVYRIGEWL